MLPEFKKYISNHKLIKEDDRILLAVSGGIDSMVMAHLFLNLPNETAIAHCNFSLRSRESDDDEQFVKNYAADHNIPFYSRRFETREYASEKGISVQMAARELRYTWFEDLRSELKFDLIAIAHNLNDNIETLIINLTRGTGLAGLSGMRPSSNNIIRPVLFATREQITRYSNEHGIAFREDRSNSDTNYVRNKIRHLVIPVLKEINPSIENTLNETAERFFGLNELVNEFINNLRESISEIREDSIIFNLGILKSHIENRTILFELFRPYGITNVQIDDLRKVICGKPGGQIFTSTHRLIKDRKELLVTTEDKSDSEDLLIRNIDELRRVKGIESAEYVPVKNISEIPSDPSYACLDSEKLKFPLIIRKWKPGDYFHPFGMKQRKKLSDYFIDRKYSILVKEKKIILETDGKIAWIIGDRIDNRFRITKSSSEALIISSRKKPLVIKRLT